MSIPSDSLVALLAVLIAGPALVLLLSRFRRALAISRDLARGAPLRVHDFVRIAAYHDQILKERPDDSVDDRTWRDLDMNEVLVAVDRTASSPGQQYLYHAMRVPAYEHAPLLALEAAVDRFRRDPALADRVRAILAPLGGRRSSYLADIVLADLPPRPRFWWGFPTLTAGAIVSLFLAFVWPRAILILLAVSAATMWIQVIYKPQVEWVIPGLRRMAAFIEAVTAMGKLDVGEIMPCSVLKEAAGRLRTLRFTSSWLVFESWQANELAATLYQYLNLLFLLDINAFVFGIDAARAEQVTLRRAFDALGWIDLAQSIARWRGELPLWTTPEFTGHEKALGADAVFHPLIPAAVPNSFMIAGVSALITGSNMSGKTTFVRTIGINALLAQSLHTVCASSWRAPFLTARASIGRGDSLLEGKSYYLAEVETVRSLIFAKAPDRQHLFLIDEIFRGTNTTERVAAGRAVLAHLTRGDDIVIVATHDLELLPMLTGTYEAFHFREQISNGALLFDFILRPGASSTRNAIALLELMNYPEQVVKDALEAVDWLERPVQAS